MYDHYAGDTLIHSFRYYREREVLEAEDAGRLTRLIRMDRLMEHGHEPDDLETLTDDQLRDLLLSHGHTERAAEPVPSAPTRKQRVQAPKATNPYAPVEMFKAQLKLDGANVYIGSFAIEDQRRDVLTLARAMHSLGIDRETIRAHCLNIARTAAKPAPVKMR